MALDWGQNISLAGLRKRAPKAKAEYPSKTYINLMPDSRKKTDVRKSIPAVVLVILVTALICKFGVFDFYDRVAQKQAELSTQKAVLSDLERQLVDYDAVKAEYDLYESSKLVSEDLLVSPVEALDLVDKLVRPVATISSINIQGNTVTLQLSDISLDGVGKLVNALYEQSMVLNVSVSTAATDESDNRATTATVVITLQR